MNDTPRPSAASVRIVRAVGHRLVLAAALAPAFARAEAPPASPVVHLARGEYASGSLVDSDRAGAIRWQSPSFVEPFEFPRDAVAFLRYPDDGKPARAPGALGFELSGGDVLYGSLLGLDGRFADLDVVRLGRQRVDRSRLRRIFRWRDGADLVHDGPNGLAGWREVVPGRPRPDPNPRPGAMVMGFDFKGDMNGPPPIKAKDPKAGPGWVEDGRQLNAVREGATIQADVGLPSRASIELELAWEQPPDFLVALGVSDDEASVARAFRLEVWAGQLVAVRETDKEADLVAIRPIEPGPGRAHLRLYLDQDLGTLSVLSESGQPLAELKLAAPRAAASTAIRLANLRGDLRLQRLRVARWEGALPRPPGPAGSKIELTDNSVVAGPVERFDPATREFLVGGPTGESRVAEDRVSGVYLVPPGDEPARPVRVSYHDGTEVGGDWVGVEGGHLLLASAGFDGTLRLPQDGIRAVDVARRGAKPAGKEERIGELEMDGVSILGHLVASTSRAGDGPLVWQPRAGGPPVTIRPGASGKITYHVPSRPPDAPEAGRKLSERGVGPASPERLMPQVRRALYLRTGDILPVEVKKIDEAGVWFRTSISENGFVANERVKAVELAPEAANSIKLTKAKFERLLTLPRMQKENPPKHLIRSTNGDILRGTLVGMDDKTIGVEVRLEEKVIPRDRISRIIWLRPDEPSPAPNAAAVPRPAAGQRVQAVRSDGIRLTFQAERFADGLLSGQSDVLGPCKVRPEELDQLLLNGSVEKEAVQLAYQNLRLLDAPEPKSAQAQEGDSPNGGVPGTESALVGKMAPDFQLDLLGGKAFRLADARGHVVVLDFWATWCGPCLQAMPQVEGISREFAAEGVQLVAVNLQEAPAKVAAMLERHKLTPTVALDRDGVVAARYGANAIPQTVVIDREGKVFRLFIGGGPHLGDQLRDALKALVPPAKP